MQHEETWLRNLFMPEQEAYEIVMHAPTFPAVPTGGKV